MRNSKNRFLLVLVTAPDSKVARVLAQAALKERLAACVNLLPKIESHYWWQGKIEAGSEVLMVIKTRAGSLKALERLVLTRHPYDVPEFVVLPILAGNKRYLGWWAEEMERARSGRSNGRPSGARG
jgi:periplasmic divalent cation tolerance protein